MQEIKDRSDPAHIADGPDRRVIHVIDCNRTIGHWQNSSQPDQATIADRFNVSQ
jgi:hypothetical protein